MRTHITCCGLNGNLISNLAYLLVTSRRTVTGTTPAIGK